jgi:hypothetical protein
MLTPRDAFKVGFLARCAEEGLSADQITERVKLAADKFAGLMDSITGLGQSAVSTGLPLAALAPIALGGVAGYGLSRMTDIDDSDVADIKHDELLDTYAAETARAKRQKAVRDFKAQAKPPRQFGI